MPQEWGRSEVMRRAQVCRLAMSDGHQPYIVPLCFGYQEGVLYIHSAAEGRKLDMIRKNDCVCFEFEADVELVENPGPCDWSMRYKCVIGYGKAHFIEETEEKRKALNIIMSQYSSAEFNFPQGSLSRTVVIKIAIESISAKQSGWPG